MLQYQYKMLSNTSPDKLMKDLEVHRTTGFEPFGSPFFGVKENVPQFYQAITRVKSKQE